uniref:Uncharacterized protein n=1 Tax=Cajanus cajan TaxID=3821 RepID=A0A151TAK8_CAJCA|nr:hypothetical protein KK1_018643 [Cajanus cajan]
MPTYARFMKELLTKKKRFIDEEAIELDAKCSAFIQKPLPPKLKDLGSFTILITIRSFSTDKALMANKSINFSYGVVKDVLVKVGNFIFLMDFVVMDMAKDMEIPLILESPFMKMTKIVIDVDGGKLKVRAQDEKVTFSLFEDKQKPSSNRREECLRINTLYKIHISNLLKKSKKSQAKLENKFVPKSIRKN